MRSFFSVVAFLVLATMALGCGHHSRSGGGGTSAPPPAPVPQQITFTPNALPTITRGQPYDQTVTVSGGTAPFTFSAQGFPTSMGGSGANTTFRITGATNAAPGAYQLTISVTDARGAAASKVYTLTVQ